MSIFRLFLFHGSFFPQIRRLHSPQSPIVYTQVTQIFSSSSCSWSLFFFLPVRIYPRSNSYHLLPFNVCSLRCYASARSTRLISFVRGDVTHNVLDPTQCQIGRKYFFIHLENRAWLKEICRKEVISCHVLAKLPQIIKTWSFNSKTSWRRTCPFRDTQLLKHWLISIYQPGVPIWHFCRYADTPILVIADIADIKNFIIYYKSLPIYSWEFELFNAIF